MTAQVDGNHPKLFGQLGNISLPESRGTSPTMYEQNRLATPVVFVIDGSSIPSFQILSEAGQTEQLAQSELAVQAVPYPEFPF
jgi:hypothetical protein